MDHPAVPSAAGACAGRTFVILNPAAGHQAPDRLRRRVVAAFHARGAAFDIADTGRPGHAAELARQAAQAGYRAVCMVGGDGTLAEVATGLAGSDTALAIIPRGTANQVARNLRIPLDLERAVDVALRGRVTAMDLGRIDSRAFALAVGAGYDAAVMAAASRPLKERWGFAAYLYAAMREALHAAPLTFRLTLDGRDIELRAMSVIVANVGELFASFLPFTLPLAPRGCRSWQDGLLDVLVIAPAHLAEFPAVLWQAARQRVGQDRRLLHFQARHIVLHADPPAPVQIDGDPAGQTPVTAAVVPAGVRVLTPA
ncbi:MAG: diacylglycerol kinase family lipid kinase [Gemmatimonadetes bacterium]|nr:diacylglycerol kinase family lipid kinase [Gemmatimonadota bacterium]